MTAPLDLNAVALRKTPTVRFEGPFLIQYGPYPYIAVMNGSARYWRADGRSAIFSDHPNDLVPLITKREPLRCWVTYYPDTTERDKFGSVSSFASGVEQICQTSGQVVEMIKLAEFDRVKAAGQALADAVRNYFDVSEPSATFDMSKALAAWKDAVK